MITTHGLNSNSVQDYQISVSVLSSSSIENTEFPTDKPSPYKVSTYDADMTSMVHR